MKARILIVEDQFIEANNLKIILKKAGYLVCPLASSVPAALKIIENEKPDLVLLDIHLDGNLTGIDLAKSLREKDIAFVFLSANSNKETLDEAKVTRPYGFLVKPFREKDILVTLDIAWYLHEQYRASKPIREEIINQPLNHSKIPAFSNIIGNSGSLKTVLDMVLMVAASETSVLLLGETGTGKERIAECIHALSPKKNKPFIKVNCAALPPALIESELFGHERGAFTGASEKRIGKFEQANGGTIFLDEIGEMTPEMQVKLLRVLQEKEIQRVGGTNTLKMDVRVIAATNRNLEREIAEGRFRMDLYYRLNVFPIALPPLRERKEDIPVLALHFMHLYNRKIGKQITNISSALLEKLVLYDWPGNIRELENLMERSILLTSGSVIAEITLPGLLKKKSILSIHTQPVKTIEENERDYIIATLKNCNGKISGEGGAAELLNINASTLTSRIKKLGIKKEHFFEEN
ncbi:MAG TPA: sigma-54 dependent transcriptional regulator [Chitinophagaceae bacterium]|nr:sigma-54 dependent transcriptional regulator [Chitinophagaceae bacterium]